MGAWIGAGWLLPLGAAVAIAMSPTVNSVTRNKTVRRSLTVQISLPTGHVQRKCHEIATLFAGLRVAGLEVCQFGSPSPKKPNPFVAPGALLDYGIQLQSKAPPL
jgi:hypothetical protein